MKITKKTLLMAALVAAGIIVESEAGADGGYSSMKNIFLNPPPQAQPQIHYSLSSPYDVIDDAVAEQEMRLLRDLGIRYLYIRDQGQRAAVYPQEEWFSMMERLIRIAHSLELQIVHLPQPYYNYGGAPVPKEDAHKALVWSCARVSGGQRIERKLDEPYCEEGFFNDSVVLAWPADPSAPKERLMDRLARVEAENSYVPRDISDLPETMRYWKGCSAEAAIDGNPYTSWAWSRLSRKPGALTFEFETPVAVSAISLLVDGVRGAGELQVEDGQDGFRKIADVSFNKVRDPMRVDFDPITARRFRFVSTKGWFNIVDVELLGEGESPRWDPAVRFFELNAGANYLHGDGAELGEKFQRRQPAHTVRPDSVIDLTHCMAADGTLQWDAPAGEWNIVRIGYTLGLRATTRGYQFTSHGYYVDPLDPSAMHRFLDATTGRLLDRLGDAAEAVTWMMCDSWESGHPNWTARMPQEFERRRGYSLLPWMPVLLGEVVGDMDETRRFLFDYRQTLAELHAEGYYGAINAWAHERGIQTQMQSGGPHCPPYDALGNLAIPDVPMGENYCHLDPDDDTSVRQAPWIIDSEFFSTRSQSVSAAHLNGRNVVSCEAFYGAGSIGFDRVPFDYKRVTDDSLAHGMNWLMLWWTDHLPEGVRPGRMGSVKGNHFNSQLWWEQAGPWLRYLGRCQALLQQGIPDSDILFYYGEGSYKFQTGESYLPYGFNVTDGFKYDFCDAASLMNRLDVRNGNIVLPDGLTYEVLVLPEDGLYSPEVLEHILALVEKGATVIGNRPMDAPGLKDHAARSARVRELAARGWGDLGPQKPGRHALGSGAVYCGVSLDDVLTARGARPALRMDTGDQPDAEVSYLCKHVGDMDLYFIANLKRFDQRIECLFHVPDGNVPELWDANLGDIRPAPPVARTPDGLTMTLELAPRESVFVVFRPETVSGAAVDRTPSGQIEVDGPWSVFFDGPYEGEDFEVTPNTLALWNESDDPRIRGFSGTAIYRTTFTAPENSTMSTLTLGRVEGVGTVVVNGQEIGGIWAPPYRLNLGGAVQAGENKLEIRVTGSWKNRAIHEQSKPRNEWRMKGAVQIIPQDAPLDPSGLLGPVRIETFTEKK